MLHRDPCTVLCTACDALFDEIHAFYTIVNVRIKCVDSFNRLLLRDVDHSIKGGDVNIGERFEERFGVATGKSASATTCH